MTYKKALNLILLVATLFLNDFFVVATKQQAKRMSLDAMPLHATIVFVSKFWTGYALELAGLGFSPLILFLCFFFINMTILSVPPCQTINDQKFFQKFHSSVVIFVASDILLFCKAPHRLKHWLRCQSAFPTNSLNLHA